MLYAAPQLPSVATRTAQTVMLVDDDPYVREAGERMLKRLGYQVNAFGCPLEALEAFRRVPPPCDLVITDLTMPKMSGDELTRRMHSIAPSIPVVICSGYRPEDAGDSAIFDYCVTMSKPFTLMELQATVEAALQWIASV